MGGDTYDEGGEDYYVAEPGGRFGLRRSVCGRHGSAQEGGLTASFLFRLIYSYYNGNFTYQEDKDMAIYRFIKIRGKQGAHTGYFVPHMYQLVPCWHVLKTFGLDYIKERLSGWTIWYVLTEDDYIRAVDALNELKKTRLFDYKVM